jgi:uncharacterized membrane protein YgcG
MPTPDPNQKMEELLRAYARKRRDEAGAPFELPADVRARLQAEVRSALRKAAAAPAPRWGLSLAGWLRLALAGSVAVLVILMLRSNTAPPASSRLRLAKAEEKVAAPAAPTTAPLASKPSPPVPAPLADTAKMPVAAAAPVVSPPTVAPPAGNRAQATRNLSTPDEAAAKAAFDKTTAMPKPATAGDLAAGRGAGYVESAVAGAPAGGGGGGGFGGGGARGGGGGRGGRGGAVGAIADSHLASISQPATGNVNFAEQAASSTVLGNLQSAVPFAQQMARSEPALRVPMERNRESKTPSSGVLATFKIERNGDQVRIVDADGSAYEGRVVASEMPDQSQMISAERRAANDLSVPPGAAAPAQPKAPQGNNFADNLGAQSHGPVNAPASAATSRAASNYDNFAQNNANASQSNLAGTQPAGDESGFAFQVSGLNFKLNQSVNIIGNCAPMPLEQGAVVIGGNFSNQIQAVAGANNAVVLPARPPAGQSRAASNSGNIVNYQNNAATPTASPSVQNAQYGLNSANLQNMNSITRFWRVTGEVQVGASNRFNLDAASVQP